MSKQGTDNVPPVVLVTGSSRGLGRGIAVHLARSGYSVAVNYANNKAAAEETLQLCRNEKQREEQEFLAFQADIAMKPDRDRMVDSILEKFGRLDGLVNNAGMAPRQRADITEATEESFEEVLHTNLQGPYFLTQRIARYWLSKTVEALLPHGFKVVFVTSISSHTASFNRGEYCISKAGLSMAVQLWSARLAAEGIQVYEVRPGIMFTDMTGPVKEKYDKMIADGLIPQMRWGFPDDVGRAVRALIDGAFPYSTGTVIDVDGGFHLRTL